MNGRVYDPTLGRFLSVDPVIATATNGQALNPYSYVLNNPLSLTDPSGYTTECPTGQTCPNDSGLKPGQTAQVSYTPTGSHVAVTITATVQADGNVAISTNAGNNSQVAQNIKSAANATFGNGATNTQGAADALRGNGQDATSQTKTVQVATVNNATGGQGNQNAAPQRLSYDDVKKLVHDNNESGQSDELITAMTWKESRFDPSAKSSDPNSTATGLMQVTKTADKDLVRLKGSAYSWDKVTDPKNPAMNIRAGSLYLGLRIQWSGGDVTKGLDGYGTGKGYATDILKAEADLKLGPKNPQQVLINDIGKP